MWDHNGPLELMRPRRGAGWRASDPVLISDTKCTIDTYSNRLFRSIFGALARYVRILFLTDWIMNRSRSGLTNGMKEGQHRSAGHHVDSTAG